MKKTLAALRERTQTMEGKNKGKRVLKSKRTMLIPLIAILVLGVTCAVMFGGGKTTPDGGTKDNVVQNPVEQGGDSSGNNTDLNTDPEKQPDGGAEDQPKADLEIVTPFCTLYFPSTWGDSIRTEQVDLGYGHTVRFYGTAGGQEAELFSILFGFDSETSVCLGSVTQNGISTDIHVDVVKAPTDGAWTAGAAQEIASMQDAASYLVGKLVEEPSFRPAELQGDESVPDVSDAVVETAYGTLYFPGQWKDAVSWEISDKGDTCIVTVFGTFSEKNVEIFTISFNAPEDLGFRMGTLHYADKDIAVCLSLSDMPQNEAWSDTERNLFFVLQEQAFYVLEKLAEDSRYTSILAME